MPAKEQLEKLEAEGYPLATSPFLSAFADQAAYFPNTYVQAPWTSSSVASLFTGLDPSTHRVMRLGVDDRGATVPDSLSENALTMAEVFRGYGYDTVLLSANPWLIPLSGLTQGFDVIRPYKASTRAHEVNSIAGVILETSSKRPKPLFMYLHYMDLHGTYRNPPAPYDQLFVDYYQALPPRRLTAAEKKKYGYIYENLPVQDLGEYLVLYDRSIRFVDAQIEWLWNKIGSLGLREQTILIVTADHGEGFLEHGQPGHGRGVHQEQVRVPLLWWQPQALPGRRDDMVQLEDVFPTLLEMIGLDASEAFAPDGRSFRRALTEGSRSAPGSVWSENHIRGIRQVALAIDGLKWHYDLDREELVAVYDAAADPAEKSDLLDHQSLELVAKVEGIVRRRLAADEAKARQLGFLDGQFEIPAGTREELEALGYLD